MRDTERGDASYARGRRERLLDMQTVRYQEDTVKSAAEQRNVRTFVYNIECEWENLAMKGKLSFFGGGGGEQGDSMEEWKGKHSMDKITFKIIINAIDKTTAISNLVNVHRQKTLCYDASQRNVF
jgi:hypothetical protein